MKKILIISVCIPVLLSTCIGYTGDFESFYRVFAPREDKIIIMPDRLRINMERGSKIYIELKTVPENLSISWESENEKICRIIYGDGKGCVVSGGAPGKTKINAIHRQSGTNVGIEVSVLKPRIGIKLDRETARMNVGETLVLNAYLNPEGAEESIEWSVFPEDDGMLMSAGESKCRVKAVENGHFTITAKLSDGQSAHTEIEVEGKKTENGYRLCVGILFSGSAALLLLGYKKVKECGKK